ncbi:hypothetical protein ACF3NS_14815 [Arsenicicoccus cauae]|uniref:hypothetical protein n=1 Tax=Arsenicicoccus cauae TaxID=2663847 RepID=UPI00370DC8CA
MRATKQEKDAVRAYVEDQAHEDVVHLEKAASELVGPVRHDIWDVHCAKTRWWVVTNPTNLYDQGDFKSRDVVLTFHVGLTLRVQYAQEREVPVAPGVAVLLPGSWRRWEQAFEAYDSGDEAENLQSVGCGCGSVWCRSSVRSGRTTSCRRARPRQRVRTSRVGQTCSPTHWRRANPRRGCARTSRSCRSRRGSTSTG